MEIKQTTDNFSVERWQPRQRLDYFKIGSKIQSISSWSIGINSTLINEGGSIPYIQLTLTLTYELKEFLNYQVKDIFYVYNHKDPSNDFESINGAIRTLY